MHRSSTVSSRSIRVLSGHLFAALVMSLVGGAVRGNADSQKLAKQPEPSALGPTLVVEIDANPKEAGGNPSRFPAKRSLADAPLEVVGSLDLRPLAIALTPDDRLFFSVGAHLGDLPEKDGAFVRELLPDGSSRAFPSSSSTEVRSSFGSFTKVLALEADSRGVLWILDSGAPPESQPKLVGWDTNKEALSRIVYLPAPLTKPNSSLVSVAIDEKREMAYIADQGRSDFVGKSESAIISVDLKTGAAWRALEDHYSLNADGGDFIVKGEPLLAPDGRGALVRPSLGVVSVASGPEDEFVLFGAANGRSVFRIGTEALSDPNLSPAQVGERVQRLGDKPPSHGFCVLASDQVLISDVNNNAIGFVGPAGKYEVLVSSEELSWPTAFARGSRGEVYVTSSQLHRAPLFHRGEDQSKRPFLVARFYPRVIRQEPPKNKPAADPKKRQARR